jgi:hypothetical protein
LRTDFRILGYPPSMENSNMTYHNAPPALRRNANPRDILQDPQLISRISDQLIGAPWDVFSTPEVAAVLRKNLSPLVLNDWLHKREPCAPPREPMYAWRGNTGYYRKDVLIGWARTGGRLVRPHQVWLLSADYLSQTLNMRHPWTLRDTEEDIRWLLDRGAISLRAKRRLGPFLPFTDDPMAQCPDWGDDPTFPNGLVAAC